MCDGLDDDGDGWIDEGALIRVPELAEAHIYDLTTAQTLWLPPVAAESRLPGVRTVTRTEHPFTHDWGTSTYGT